MQRRRSLPKPDPEHVAKRKRFIAQQFLHDGKHPIIKKTITWDDVGRSASINEQSAKRMRLSQSQTPGLSDKSYTPTPAARPLPSALKSATSSKTSLANSQSRSLSQVKKEVILLPPTVQPTTPSGSAPQASRLPKKSTPAPPRVRQVSNETNRVSDPVSDQLPDSENIPASGVGHATTRNEAVSDGPQEPAIDRHDNPSEAPRPLFLPDSDDERERQLEDYPDDDNAWLTRPSRGRHSPSPEPDSARPPSLSGSLPEAETPQAAQPAKDAAARSAIIVSSTSSHVAPATTSVAPSTPSPRPKAGLAPRQKRRRSSTGVQTVPEGEVDWLEGVEIDASMSAIDVSRVWASSSPARGEVEVAETAEDEGQPGEGDEPMGASFLEEFEGRRAGVEGEPEQPTRAESIGPFSDADEGIVEESNSKGVSTNEDHIPVPEQDGAAEHRFSSPEPVPAQDHSQSRGSSPDPISLDHYAGMTEDVQTFENGAASLPHTSTPTGLRTYGPEFTSRVSALRASVSQPINPQVAPYPFHLRAEPDPKPTSTSQPNRARSRMYTPQPLPRQALRAAPTLGRSMYGDTDVREKSMEKETNALRAAPTLGRSMLGDAPGGISSTGDAEVVETPEGMETAEVVHKRHHQDSSRSRRVLSSTPVPVPVPAPLSPPAQKAAKPPPEAIEPPSTPEPQPAPSKAPLVSEPKVAGSASQPQLLSAPRSTTPVQEREDSAGVSPSIAVGLITRSFDDEFQRDAGGRTASPAPESEGIHAPVDYPSVKSQSRSVEPESNGAEPKSPDYDAEYGSVPDVPSVVSQSEPQEPPHIIISSSPTNNGTWTLQRNRSSTPQFQSTLPRSGPPVLHIDSPPVRNKHRARRPGLTTSTPRPVSLVSLGKRRRSSLAASQSQETPRPVSKKIRREYDTVESGAFPKNTRAHEDTYDQWGRRRWAPNRPSMHRAPETEEAKKIARPIERRVVTSPESESGPANADEGEAPPDNTAAADGPALQGDEIIEQEAAPENQEQESGEPRENFSSTEVPETPQFGPFAQFSESILEPIDKPSLPIAGPSRIADKAPAFVAEAPTPAVARSSSPVSAPRSREQSRASPFVSFSSSLSRSRGSKRKSELSGLQFTPGSGPDRTRLSLGHRSGPAVEQVSERDAQILQKAGLKPTLKRLSQAHGFTTEIVADVYQEHGDLKETEEALREMKRSAERTRVKIARRMSMRDSTMGVFHGRQQEGDSDDEVEADTFSAFDATRTRREILFGV